MGKIDGVPAGYGIVHLERELYDEMGFPISDPYVEDGYDIYGFPASRIVGIIIDGVVTIT